MAASNQVINVFNTNALPNQIHVDPNVLLILLFLKKIKTESLKSAFHTAEII